MQRHSAAAEVILSSPTGTRYHPMIIRYCLSLAAKSSSYEELHKSKILVAQPTNPQRLSELHQAHKGISRGCVVEQVKGLTDTYFQVQITVTETSVTRKLRQISASKASGPHNLPNWLLKEYADILAPAVVDILNTSYRECKVPSAWKLAEVPASAKRPNSRGF